MKKEALIVDIETTGFLPDGKIVEIGAVSLDFASGKITTVFNSTMKDPRLKQSDRDAWIFKNSDLTVQMVSESDSSESVMLLFQDVVYDFPFGVTAFNRNFDIKFLESYGIGFINLLPCPMLIMTPICKLKYKNSRPGNKWPSVEEAWSFLFPDQTYIEKHRGLDDAEHEAMIIFELYRRGEYPL